MPLQATSGAASYDAFGGGVPVVPTYIEDIFSCFLYTGNGSTQTITNGIDLAGKGGLVWWKNRTNATGHGLIDTTRGIDYYLSSNTADAQDGPVSYISSVSSTGYSIGAGTQFVNQSANNYASWTFRKQPKFFDVVTYTGTGSVQNISHNLGSAPACMIVKDTTNAGSAWAIYHTSLGNTQYLQFTTSAAGTSSGYWNNTSPTSTQFTVGTNGNVNQSGATYVAYLFANNAGGFGLTGTDNVISCGSFDANNGEVINLGYEPQWLLYKASSDVDNWRIADNMRGLTNLAGTNAQTIKQLRPNSSAVESENSGPVLTSTGFTWNQSGGGVTHIYIAIRRGPMKVPTSGTSVFSPVARTGTGTATSISGVGFVPDFFLSQNRNVPGDPGPASSLSIVLSRLTNLKFLRTQTTSAEGDSTEVTSWNQSGVSLSADTFGRVNDTSVNTINYFIGRAPSFFDEVCYTGTGSNITLNHNLGAVPELMIFKTRTGAARAWGVYSSAFGVNKKLVLNTTAAVANDSFFVDTTPTATVFYPGNADESNEGGNTYVAYLFATCAGVSKVGSYTGNGTTQTISCGFTGGARFVMIKATSTMGDWMVADSARGIVSGSDPYLELNNTNAEVTGEDWLDTDSTGFVVNQVSASNANTNGVTYIYLAIA